MVGKLKDSPENIVSADKINVIDPRETFGGHEHYIKFVNGVPEIEYTDDESD